MRAIFVLVLLLLVSAAPTAAAASSTLDMMMDEGEVPGNATIPVTFRLTVSEFMCHEPRDFVLTLTVNTTEGVKALFETSTVTMPVPARSYYVEPYEGDATVNLSTRALTDGDMEITAAFAADRGPCFVPGGFDPIQVTMMRSVKATGGAPAEPTTPSRDAPVTNETPSNTSAPPPTASRPTPTNNAGVCAPQTTCGNIGEFQPQESAEAEKDTPGLGVVALVGALGCIALLARRR